MLCKIPGVILIVIPEKALHVVSDNAGNILTKRTYTSQLRDFAKYANDTHRTLELYVRPTTKVAQTVIDAGWNIKYLW